MNKKLTNSVILLLVAIASVSRSKLTDAMKWNGDDEDPHIDVLSGSPVLVALDQTVEWSEANVLVNMDDDSRLEKLVSDEVIDFANDLASEVDKSSLTNKSGLSQLVTALLLVNQVEVTEMSKLADIIAKIREYYNKIADALELDVYNY